MDSMQYSLGLYEKAMPPDLSFREKLLLTQKSNFDFMEISIDESADKQARLDYSDAQLSEIKAAMDETGIYIRSMCLSLHRKFPLGSHDAEVRNKSLHIMQKAIDFACKLGIRFIQLAGYDVYYETGDEQTRLWFMENLAACVRMAACSGITLGFETMETPFMDTVQKAMQYVTAVGSPYLGVYPDIGNLKNAAVLYGTDVVDDIQLGKTHIFAAHLKETLPGKYRDMYFGTGHTEYERYIRELWMQGVRIFTGEFWYQGETNYEEILQNSSAFLRGKIECVSIS